MTHALRASIVLAAIIALMPACRRAEGADKWVTSWAASVQGPYPVGNPSAQPDQKFAFPSPEAGARDQTFRLIVLPEIWGKQARLRFSNAFGTKPMTIDGVYRRAAARQRHARARHQPAGDVRRQAERHDRARQGCVERRGRAAVRAGRKGAAPGASLRSASMSRAKPAR